MIQCHCSQESECGTNIYAQTNPSTQSVTREKSMSFKVETSIFGVLNQ